MSGEVTAAELPSVRDSTTGARPRASKAPRNIRPGSTTAIYWSEASTFVPMQAATRVATRAPAERAAAITGPIRRSSTPAFSMNPPKASATRMSQTVPSMLAMPPRESSSSTAGSPVAET